MKNALVIDNFLEMLSAERGAAKNTLEAYRRDLEDYASFLEKRGRDAAGSSADDIRAWLTDLSRRAFAPSSAARRLSAVKQLHRFLYAEGIRGDDPGAAITGPKRGRPLPKVLSVQEVDDLLAAAADGIDDAERPHIERLRAARMTALLEILYATGLRVSELVTLPRSARGPKPPAMATAFSTVMLAT